MSLRDIRQSLIDDHGLKGEEFCRAYAAAADSWLTELLDSASNRDAQDLALIAVGGYGGGMLCPYSDLDLVLIHRGKRNVTSIADKIWYPVWDEGIRLDHSVRRPAEVLELAAEDLRVQLGLLQGRLIAGDPKVVSSLFDDALELWQSKAPVWLPVLADQVDERRRTNGDVAFLLEPELKESHGGLRDITVLQAASLGVPQLQDEVDIASLDEAHKTLTESRVELHRATGRDTDRLLLQEQDQVASSLDFPSADELMASISEAGRIVAWVSDDAWRRAYLWESGPKRRLRSKKPKGTQLVPATRHIEQGIDLSGQLVEKSSADEPEFTSAEVVLGPDSKPESDPSLPLRIAAVAAERSLTISRAALATLEEKCPNPTDPWPDDLRNALIRVLACGSPAISALEALDHYGLLSRILPEWSAVRNRPQRNAYHRFTVDRHLLEAAAGAATLAVRVSRPDLLLVGTLLHDIGKGFPGDHTEVGIKLVRVIATRMGFPEEDVDVLVDMVRLHLLLPDVATRRDLEDPATVEHVEKAVGNRTTLELLAALTEADSLATGPAAWGPWKAALVADLVRRVAAAMAGDEISPASSLITERHRALMKQVGRTGRSIVTADPPQVTVVAGDRAGLLTAVTGVLALKGLDVRSANVASEGDYAVEVFVVEPSRGRWPDWDLVAQELEDVLRGKLSITERLDRQAATYSGRTRPASPFKTGTIVSVDNTASATSTVVEVRTPDAVGLLHRLTRELFSCELDVVAARVSTLGAEVVDAFYVIDERSGGKITDPRSLYRIEQAMRRATGDHGDHETTELG